MQPRSKGRMEKPSSRKAVLILLPAPPTSISFGWKSLQPKILKTLPDHSYLCGTYLPGPLSLCITQECPELVLSSLAPENSFLIFLKYIYLFTLRESI